MRDIPARDLLERPGFTLLDVRAEVEFADGSVPGSVNLPLLHDDERHRVGIAYKTQGQDAAVLLGHQLVDPHRAARVAAWKTFLSAQREPVLTCFRGGMRSQISQLWLAEAGVEALRVRGGYKSLRRELIAELALPFTGFVVTGLTGSDKTGFLRSLDSPRVVDLEALAVHRGSAFGGLFQPTPQPAQQTFENALALALLLKRGLPGGLLFEDESRLVGRCVIPAPFFERLSALPRVFLEASEERRVAHVYQVYVVEPLRSYSASRVEAGLLGALRTLRNRLGGLLTDEIERAIRTAFAANPGEAEEQHRSWIQRLIRDYYDRLYGHALAKHPREAVFRGDVAGCRQFLKVSDTSGGTSVAY